MVFALEDPGIGQSSTGKQEWTQSAPDAASWATAASKPAGTTRHAALYVRDPMKALNMFAEW